MRTILPILIISFSASFSLPVHCEYLYGWGDISINYYDWTKDTETRSYGFKNDYGFIEIEGGANFSWGEIYGLFDMELQENVNEFGQKISGQSIGSTSQIYRRSYISLTETALSSLVNKARFCT